MSRKKCLTSGDIASLCLHIYEEKGDIQACGNYIRIKLLSHTMKLWEKILNIRFREETSIGDGSFVYDAGLSTTEAVFALKVT